VLTARGPGEPIDLDDYNSMCDEHALRNFRGSRAAIRAPVVTGWPSP
jgi:hypothetical protein